MSARVQPADLREMAEKLDEVHANTEDDDHAFVILGAIILLSRLAREMEEAA